MKHKQTNHTQNVKSMVKVVSHFLHAKNRSLSSLNSLITNEMRLTSFLKLLQCKSEENINLTAVRENLPELNSQGNNERKVRTRIFILLNRCLTCTRIPERKKVSLSQ